MIGDIMSEGKLSKFNIFKKIARFFVDFKSEIKKEVWPNRATVLKNSWVVLVSIFVAGVFVFSLDYAFTKILSLVTQVS
jgi:preprotein translocase subunit SecE